MNIKLPEILTQSCPKNMKLPKILMQYCPNNTKLPAVSTLWNQAGGPVPPASYTTAYKPLKMSCSRLEDSIIFWLDEKENNQKF